MFVTIKVILMHFFGGGIARVKVGAINKHKNFTGNSGVAVGVKKSVWNYLKIFWIFSVEKKGFFLRFLNEIIMKPFFVRFLRFCERFPIAVILRCHVV